MFSIDRIWQVDGVGRRLEGVLPDGRVVHRLQRRHCWMGVVVPLLHGCGMNVRCFDFKGDWSTGQSVARARARSVSRRDGEGKDRCTKDS